MATVARDCRFEIREHVVSHFMERLDQVTCQEKPFSHFFVEGVFPDAVYEELLRQMPDPSYYNPLSLRKHAREDGTSTRDVFALDDRYLSKLSGPQRSFWEGISDALRSVELQRKIFHMLDRELMRRFRTDRAGLDRIVAYAKPALIRDLSGYEIKPHPDTRSKIVTMLIYLPADHSQAKLGTSLYRRAWLPGKGRVFCRNGLFEKFKRFPFRPNSAGAFAVTRNSWHGRETVPDGYGERHTLAHIYYRDPDKGY